MATSRLVSAPTPVLRGRGTESALLEGIIMALRQGESRTLLLLGEAGIGKTALVEYLIRAASGLRVLRAVGVESEMELAYAGLHQLCAPILERVERLPGPMREALEIVLGRSEGPAPDRFLVGLGVLTLLSEAVAEGPLLCVVDDAQWLDQASARTLAFVARRLLAEPVGLVFAAREAGEELRGLPQLEVRGLDDQEARALLARAVPGRLDSGVCDRIVAETRGNPLALLELPRGMSPSELAGGFGVPRRADVPGRIELHYLRRVRDLPEATQRLLLLAAADPVGDAALVWRAAQRLAIDRSALDAAVDGDLLEIGASVRFRHPLVRSAVYRAARRGDRQRVHQALAEVSDPDLDADRRAWHRALAAAGRDEDAAAELERSAARAQTRGGVAATAAFLDRAVALTEDPARRAARALAAAHAHLQAGAFDAALRSVTTAESGPLDESQHARVDLLRAHVAFASGLGGAAPPLLLKAARRLAPFDLELARETYLTAWGVAVFAGPAGGNVLEEICREVQALPPLSAAPRTLDVLLDGLVLLITEGHAAAIPTLQKAAKALANISAEDVLQWGWMAPAASGAMWDFEGMFATLARAVQLLRDLGALAQLPVPLALLGMVTASSGDLASAGSLSVEADSIGVVTGSEMAPFAALRLLVLQGREAEASALIAKTIEHAEALGQGVAVTNAKWAAAVLYNGLGRYEEAAAAAREATSHGFGLYDSMWALPELVEAAARRGDIELARDALARLAETTQPSGTDFALGIEARSRALLSEGETAERLYQQTIERLGRTRLRTELARAHLLYGEWLRRENRRVAARAELRVAYQQFTSIGMEAFAERARKELLATGERIRRRTVETRDDLTAQERQIAELARDGLSNPEIGERLFLSPRTVEWHLRKVFGKLGIRSRRELANALTASQSELVSV